MKKSENMNCDSIYQLNFQKQNDLFHFQDHLIMLILDDNYINQTINLMLSIVKNQKRTVSFYCVSI